MSLPEDKDPIAPHGADKVEVQADVPVQYPDAPAIVAETKNAALLESGKFPKQIILDGVNALIERGPLDPVDRQYIDDAVAYINKPTNDFATIKQLAMRIGEIPAGYMMNEEETPAEIEALMAYFYGLECVNRMNFVEGELAKGVTDSPEIEAAITQALADAEVFATGYARETTLLEAATALHDRLPEEVRNSMADRKLANVTIRNAPFSKDPAEAN